MILASGGFEKNQTLREKYLPKPTDKAWSAANIHNTGDAISATEDLNVALHQMDAGWWTTTMNIPGHEKGWLSIVDKSVPGNYTVNKNGHRCS